MTSKKHSENFWNMMMNFMRVTWNYWSINVGENSLYAATATFSCFLPGVFGGFCVSTVSGFSIPWMSVILNLVSSWKRNKRINRSSLMYLHQPHNWLLVYLTMPFGSTIILSPLFLENKYFSIQCLKAKKKKSNDIKTKKEDVFLQYYKFHKQREAKCRFFWKTYHITCNSYIKLPSISGKFSNWLSTTVKIVL